MKRLKTALLISFVAFIPAAHAQLATFSFQQGEIVIARKNPPLLPTMPWAEDSTAIMAPSNVTVTVDIRSAQTLYRQEGWIDMSGFSNLHGMLFIFPQPQPAHIVNMPNYAPVDVIWIDAEGDITSIAPNLILANLPQPIIPKENSKALLLMAGGTAELYNIAPADRIAAPEYFTPPPDILSAP